MPRIVGIVGWLLAVGAAAGTGLLYVELDSAKVELAISREATDIVSAENVQLKRDNEELKRQVEQVQRKSASLGDNSGRTDDGPAGMDTASLLGSFMKNMAPGDSDAAVPDLSSSPLLSKMMESNPEMADMMGAGMKLMQSDAGKEFMSSMMGSFTRRQYQGLLDELALTPEKEREVLAILNSQHEDMMEAGMGMFTGDFDPQQMQDMAEQAEVDVRTQLAEVLTPGQLMEYDAYQADEQARAVSMMSDSYAMQLRTFGVSDDARSYAAEVIAAETMVEPEPGTDPMGEQTAGFERALATLETELSPEDYEGVQQFVQQQQRFTTMFSEGENSFADLFPVAE